MRTFTLGVAALTMMSAFSVCSADSTGLSDLSSEFESVRAQGRDVLMLDIDNDSLLLSRKDGFYSSGLRFTQKRELSSANLTTTYGWRFGHDIYTAQDIKLPPERIGPPDHPYAAWLYGGVFRETLDAAGRYRKLGLDLGCIGPCAGGEWIQTHFHKLVLQPVPKGWGKQVRNEVGAVFYAEMTGAHWPIASWLDVRPGLQGRFGNIYTDATGSLEMRLGRLDTINNTESQHGFVRLEAMAVGYNATLQGGYFSSRNPHTVEPKRWVRQAAIGMVWTWPAWSVRVSLVKRSNEIRGLSKALGAQDYLRLEFAYRP